MPSRLPALACTAALVCAGAFASFPVHADRVAWNVTIGGPGFAVSAGRPWGGWSPAPIVHPVGRPWGPVVAPAPFFVPGPVFFAPPVVPVVRPVRWRHARPVVVVPQAFVPPPVVVRPW